MGILKSIFVTITSFVILLSISFWRGCIDLAGQFHFSLFDIQLRLIEYIHNDKDTPIMLVRLFHNKFLLSSLDIVTKFISYLDLSFLAFLLTPIGVFGIAVGVYHILTGKRNVPTILLVGILVIQIFIELFFPLLVPTQMILFTTYALFAIWGIYNFLTGKKNINKKLIFLLILVGISIWWLFAQSTPVETYCRV